MEKEFVPFEESLVLKELGFEEVCFGFYVPLLDNTHELELRLIPKHGSKIILAPLYQQAFKWFREKYKLNGQIAFCEYVATQCNSWKFTLTNPTKRQHWEGEYNTYEDAELACLKRLIEIIKKTK